MRAAPLFGEAVAMHVVVAGAGIGGLTLAGLLTRLLPSAQVTVLERDTGLQGRPQGYGVGLRRSQGLEVLARLGVADEVEQHARPIEAFTLVDRRGRVLRRARAVRSGDPEQLVAIARTDLRRLLVDVLPPGTVRFGRTARGLVDGDRPRLLLDGGAELAGDLVVAADGARSSLRRSFVGRELRYVGLTRIGSVVPRVEHPLLEGGAVMTLGRGCSTFVQAFSAGLLAWSFTVSAPEDALADSSPAELLGIARVATEGWHDPVPRLLAATDPATVTVRGLYDLPALERVRGRRVVLLGDAAHAMTPYRGVGANMAMLDAAELVAALVGAQTIDEGLDRYEREMRPRNESAVDRSHAAAVSLHARGGLALLRRDVGLRAAQIRGGLRDRS